jgi:acyl carrier protein
MTEPTSESVLRELQPIFANVLDEPELVVDRSANAWTTPNWDSLAHIALVQAAELQFRVKFTLNELQAFKTVGDLVDLIIQKSSKL